MKSVTLLTTLMLGLCASSHAAIYTGSTALNGGVIPDGNPSGWSSTLTVIGAPGTAASVQVHLTLSGGFNGDLYAYLSHDGVLVPLLTRVGSTGASAQFGYGTSGMDVTLADVGTLNIHNVASPTLLGGPYKPDGQHLNTGTLQPDGPSTPSTLAAFDTTTVNGDWTVFFADVSGGAVSTVTGWSLDITAVPEPINVALGVFGGLFLIGGVCRSKRVKKLFGKHTEAID